MILTTPYYSSVLNMWFDILIMLDWLEYAIFLSTYLYIVQEYLVAA